MKNYFLIILVLSLLLPSCIVKSPKYSTVDKVMTLKLGMTREEVEQTLNLKPYNMKAATETSDVLIYVYRVKARRTLFLNTKPTNGREATGNYQQLEVTYSKAGKVTKMESCTECPDDLESVAKVDVEKLVLFVTATLPAILVYLGLQK